MYAINTLEELPRKAPLTFSLSYAAKKLNGIGESKRAAIKNSPDRVSPKIHSRQTFDRYMGIAKEFIQFARADPDGPRKLHQLNHGHALKFLREKVDKGRSQKTLKINLCALEKFFGAVGRGDLKKAIKDDFDTIYAQGRAFQKTTPFASPKTVIRNIKLPENRIVAELQYLTGARIGDVPKIAPNLETKTIVIDKSKGGRPRTIDFSQRLSKLNKVVSLRKRLDEAIKEAGGYQNLKDGYYKDLRSSVRKSGEEYTGAHAFRASYAKERFDELERKEGYGIAERVLTKELGHNRAEMSHYYRR